MINLSNVLNKKINLSRPLIALLAVSTVGVSFLGTSNHVLNAETDDIGKAFSFADSNKDSKLTLSEFDSYVINLFSSADANKNKRIDKAELTKNTKSTGVYYDKNRDGVISFKEVMNLSHAHFKAADQNKDKFLSEGEVRAFGAKK